MSFSLLLFTHLTRDCRARFWDLSPTVTGRRTGRRDQRHGCGGPALPPFLPTTAEQLWRWCPRFTYLGVHLAEAFTWRYSTSSVVDEARRHCAPTSSARFRGVLESTLTSCTTVWHALAARWQKEQFLLRCCHELPHTANAKSSELRTTAFTFS